MALSGDADPPSPDEPARQAEPPAAEAEQRPPEAEPPAPEAEPPAAEPEQPAMEAERPAPEPPAPEAAAAEPEPPAPEAEPPAARKPAARKPAARKPAARKPAAHKKPAAPKKPAARKPPEPSAATPALDASDASDDPTSDAPAHDTPPPPLTFQAVVFSLADDEYALPIDQVHEVIAFREPRSVASGTSWVRGVINLRGVIVPVCDLAARLGRDGGQAPSAKIVIVEAPTGQAGLIVDSVREVLTITADQLDRVTFTNDAAVTSIAKLGERLVVMLDAPAVLAEADDLQGTGRRSG